MGKSTINGNLVRWVQTSWVGLISSWVTTESHWKAARLYPTMTSPRCKYPVVNCEPTPSHKGQSSWSAGVIGLYVNMNYKHVQCKPAKVLKCVCVCDVCVCDVCVCVISIYECQFISHLLSPDGYGVRRHGPNFAGVCRWIHNVAGVLTPWTCVFNSLGLIITAGDGHRKYSYLKPKTINSNIKEVGNQSGTGESKPHWESSFRIQGWKRLANGRPKSNCFKILKHGMPYLNKAIKILPS